MEKSFKFEQNDIESRDVKEGILDNLVPVGEEEQYKEIIRQICSMVNSGQLKSGQKLPGERVLAQRFEVGRASVRIALKFLEFIGLVQSKVGKGVFISANSRDLAVHHVIELLDTVREDPFKDLFEARMSIETAMAQLAAIRATEEDLEKMQETLEQMKKNIMAGENGIIATTDFHELIFKASKNVVLYRIAIMLGALMRESREITLNIPGRPQRSLEEHENIYRAIANHNASEASELMREHLARVAEERLARK